MGNHHHHDEDSDDSNAVRANGLQDLHCDLISAPFPVQVNNEGKGGGGGKKKGRKKERKRIQITAHPSGLPIYASSEEQCTKHKEPLNLYKMPACSKECIHSIILPSFLPFALLCFSFLPLRSHFPSPSASKQASKQASRAYAMQKYTYAPISPRISTMISP